MLTIATVAVQNYLGRQQEYTTKFFDGVRRHLPGEYRMVCLTDDPSTLPDGVEALPAEANAPGWWSKLSLLKPGMFEPGTRVVFSDLDMIPCGDLSDLASFNGVFAALHDFFFPERLGSAFMAWGAGALDHVWTTWDKCGRPAFDQRGDQFWIETMTKSVPVTYWQDKYPGQIVSFKADCWVQGRIPDGARVLGFHGHPRPHECRASYVRELWERPRLSAAA